ncbi:MAG: YbjN domain-containing protein [Lachnospiraceae bacterium]|jgi:hypothetical protein|nr:YbjN domain-containing protein [Lachnospiraceae bacterium]
MTKAEMNVATGRLFNIAGEIFKEKSIKDSLIINEEKLQIDGDFSAEPFNVHLKFSIYPENGMMTFFSLLPFDVPATKVSEFAKLVCTVNYYDFYAGNYDYNPDTGKVVFRLAVLYRGSIISSELLAESVQYVVDTVSKYNQRFFEAARDS